jgi:hypothetical protein
MANRHKMQAKAKGGGVKPKHDPDKLEYNAQGSDVMREAKSEKDDFKHGGKAKKRASGGKVVGRASGGRLDKRARGGGVGRSPFSSAHIKGHMGAASNPAPHKGH